jgi:hypothetical protein
MGFEAQRIVLSLAFLLSLLFTMSSTSSVSLQTSARKPRTPLSEEQRDVLRARLVKARAMKQVYAARRAAASSTAQPAPSHWTAQSPDLHPALRNVLAAFGPVRRSGEGCDCGEC